jgi:hypothetical protein
MEMIFQVATKALVPMFSTQSVRCAQADRVKLVLSPERFPAYNFAVLES